MVKTGKASVLFVTVALFLSSGTIIHSDDLQNLRFFHECRQKREVTDHSVKSPLNFEDQTNEVQMAGLVLLRLYQVVLSSQDGPRCMFHPSCSEFAKIAISRHGVVAGSLMAIDRYLRCNGSDRQLYPYDPRRRKLIDPVPPEAQSKTRYEGTLP